MTWKFNFFSVSIISLSESCQILMKKNNYWMKISPPVDCTRITSLRKQAWESRPWVTHFFTDVIKAVVAKTVGEFHLKDFAINLDALVHSMQMIIVMSDFPWWKYERPTDGLSSLVTTKRLYTSVCPSVGPSVGPSVMLSVTFLWKMHEIENFMYRNDQEGMKASLAAL